MKLSELAQLDMHDCYFTSIEYLPNQSMLYLDICIGDWWEELYNDKRYANLNKRLLFYGVTKYETDPGSNIFHKDILNCDIIGRNENFETMQIYLYDGGPGVYIRITANSVELTDR